MKFIHLTTLMTMLGVSQASHIVSGSSSRLPMSLSSVINDLEAEGASRITTVAFLTSRGITKSKRSAILKSLIGVTNDSNGEAVEDSTTAFGKRMSAVDDDEIEDDDETYAGIAVANPLAGASSNEVAATVQACGGNILYVVSKEDLSRGERLFDKLAPAIERIINQESEDGAVSDNDQIRNLVVVIEGATTTEELMAAKNKLENAAAIVLSTIVQPEPNNRVTTLQQVFDSVEFVASNGPVDELLEDIGTFCDPSDATASVAKAVFQDASSQTTTVAGLHKSPLDLAAARKLLPLSRKVLKSCIDTVKDNISTDGESQLVRDFGALCDASVQRSMDEFDTSAGNTLLKESTVAKRIRSDLVEEMYSELESYYEEQLELLHTASFVMFKSNLSKLRLSPNLASDMEKVAADVVKVFSETSETLFAKKNKSARWPKGDVNMSNLRKELKEYITLRLQAARADGKYRPAPRKGMTLGFHWLLPKPFGNDYRQEPWDVHAKDNLVYVPKDKITDVRKEEVLTGDWRDSVVPCPTANEMMYLK